MSRLPRVTVGVPVYDGERYLQEALESILGQTLGDLEVVVSDNASGDRSAEIASAVAAGDARVRVLRQRENLGAAGNYNAVLRDARAPLFKWCAHDDLLEPTFLERCVEALDAGGERVSLAFPRTRFVDAERRTLGFDAEGLPWDGASPATRLASLLDSWEHSFLHTCSAVCGVIRTDLLRRTPGIAPFNASDNALLVELALLGDWVQVDEPLFVRRLHEGTSLAHSSDEEVAAWFDPKASGRFPMPRTRLFRAHLSAVLRTPMGLGERRRCLGVLARRFRGEARVIGGELKIRAKQLVGLRHRPVRRHGS